MYVLAIHFAPGAGEALAAPLAEALGCTLYEARARVGDPQGGPTIVAHYGEIEPAWASAGRLRANGLAPILITPEDVESNAVRFQVRGFTLGGQTLTVVSRRGETAEVPYRELDLFLRGTHLEERTEVKTTEQRKFSAGRALLSGGLMLTKKTRTVEQVTTEDRDDFLQLYSDGRPPLVFHASGLNYQSLGTALQPSVAANFAQLIARLRQGAPQARYDERLANRAGRARILGPLKDRHLDVAVSLLARVLRS
ncbi:MAG TPA: hypothetical protein VIA62_06600 [Thermoanaerobaculia bacterium]|jgi:hypothetical protein|nr:hypothetical protein [Thermoanaerobaculia bacterium]